MIKGLYTAYTGMINQQERLDVLTNNLANAATTGYKKEGSTSQSFDDVMAVKIKDTSEAMVNKRLGGMSMGVKVGETYTDYSQGSFQVTDKTYDVALEGNGFFAISYTNKAGETSVKYTRDGAFTVNNQGYLMTKDGDFVLNQEAANGANPAGRIQVTPNAEVKIDAFGNIHQNNAVIGKIGIVDFADYNYLSKYGENLYDVVEGGAMQASQAKVHQGTLEASNVNVVSEMVEMITISRAYESNQKLIQTMDSTLEKTANAIGKI